MIKRSIEDIIRNRWVTDRTHIILGPRQSGKSTLLKQLEVIYKGEVIWLNGDIYAYEFKWKLGRAKRFPSSFTSIYRPSETRIIDRSNYYEFLSDNNFN
ncbi:MAG: hypothetical protein GY705_00250 [Bacteroidetes bacterium]|nr:hypothetical protein [Bacteroidota bacterium]